MMDIKTTLETIMKEGPTNLQNDLTDWKIENVDGRKTIFYKEKNYIPNDQKLWRDIIKMFHDHETAGHPGELETYNSVRQYYWRPGLQTFVKTYVQGRKICQQFKINRSPSHPAYQPIEGAKTTHLFANCSMDLITDLLPINGYDSILVVVDQGLSKGVILCPCAKTITWEGIFETIYSRDSDYQTKLSLIRTLDLLPEHFKNFLNSWILHHHYLQPITHRRTEQLNEKSRNRSLLINLLYHSPWRLAKFPHHYGIHTQ